MRIIGLTGPSGAGKGALGEWFHSQGVPVIDADRVYHELLIPPSACLDELTATFGKGILAPDATLDRAALASLVFGEQEQAAQRRELLNRITHRYVKERTRELLDQYCQAGHAVALIDAPLLLEAEMDAACDLVVVVLADRETRLARLTERDGKSREAILARISAQPDDDFYRSRADIVLDNNSDVAQLYAAARSALAAKGVTL